MNKGTLEYYMALDYPVEVRAIPDDMGGGYSASIPFLGRYAFYADGETAEDALRRLHEVKRVVFEDMLERGKTVPLPPPLPEEVNEDYNGHILLRVPKDLHREAVKVAEKNGCSLNQYIATVLAHHIGGAHYLEAVVAETVRVWAHQTREQPAGERYVVQSSEEPRARIRLGNYSLPPYQLAS